MQHLSEQTNLHYLNEEVRQILDVSHGKRPNMHNQGNSIFEKLDVSYVLGNDRTATT